ncbi:MAG: hypothetical protein ACYDH5_19025, partial [Acidimicrobiales bacterium]
MTAPSGTERVAGRGQDAVDHHAFVFHQAFGMAFGAAILVAAFHLAGLARSALLGAGLALVVLEGVTRGTLAAVPLIGRRAHTAVELVLASVLVACSFALGARGAWVPAIMVGLAGAGTGRLGIGGRPRRLPVEAAPSAASAQAPGHAGAPAGGAP